MSEDKVERAVDELIEILQVCMETNDTDFPSMVRFGMTPIGSKVYSKINKLRQCVEAAIETTQISGREELAMQEGAAWLKKTSKAVRSNIQVQMKGRLENA